MNLIDELKQFYPDVEILDNLDSKVRVKIKDSIIEIAKHEEQYIVGLTSVNNLNILKVASSLKEALEKLLIALNGTNLILSAIKQDLTMRYSKLLTTGK